MITRKNQLGVLLRSVLLLISLVILIQSLESPKLSMPLLQKPLPRYGYPVSSPVFQKANPLCPSPVCSRYIQPTHCPCRPLQQGFIAVKVSVIGNESYYQWQPNSEQGSYRFIKYDDLKKRLKRIVRRLLRIK